MFFWHDWTYILMIPAIVLSLYAQWKVTATFRKYAEVRNRRGLTGADVAQAILSGHGTDAGVSAEQAPLVRAGVMGVKLEAVPGELSDHYDPSAKVLRLSEPVYGSASIAAVAVAAHEAGHALQHAVSYPALGLRSVTVPIANVGSMLAFPIIIVGMLIGHARLAIDIAILLYLGVVAFTVITLPVEFNASARALRVLANGGYLYEDEIPGARAVLQAAALTYVAATVSAILMLLRLFLMRGRD
jgi:Zn-dependent membrane protease YugP